MNIISEIQILLMKNQIEEAEQLLKENKKNLEFDDYQAYRGLCLELKHKPKEALKEYEKIQDVEDKINPKFYYYHVACCLNSLGKHNQALANLVKIEEDLSKRDVMIHWQFYTTYYALNKPEEALEHIESICKVTKDPFYSVRYAYTLNQLGRDEEAYTIGKKLLKKKKEDSIVLYILASSSYNLKKYDESEKYLLKLMEQNESSDWTLLYLANLSIYRDQYEKSLEFLKKIKRKDSQVYVKMAFCYSSLDKRTQAIHYYEKAVQEDPKNVVAIRSLSTYYRMTGKYKEAMDELKKYQKMEPEENAIAYYEMSRVESDRENYKKSISFLEKAKKIQEDPLFDCDIAWNYKQLGNYSKAQEYLEKVRESYPEDAWVLHELGYCKMQLSHYQEALEVYRQVDVTKGDISKDRYYYELGFLEESQGESERAFQAFAAIEKKDNYTYGHLVECAIELQQWEQIDEWMKKINIEKEKDPWFYEVYLDYLEVKNEYATMMNWLEKHKRKIPELLYLKKKVQALIHLSTGKLDSKLKEAEKLERKILNFEPENPYEILTFATIYNRMELLEEAKAYLTQLEKRNFHSPDLKREWIYLYSLSPKIEWKKKALEYAKEVYESTQEKKDYMTLLLQNLNLGYYHKTLWMTKKLRKEEIWQEKIQAVRGICYNKMGLKKYSHHLLNPLEKEKKETRLIERYLGERKEKE